jgi:hypothetical protein
MVGGRGVASSERGQREREQEWLETLTMTGLRPWEAKRVLMLVMRLVISSKERLDEIRATRVLSGK